MNVFTKQQRVGDIELTIEAKSDTVDIVTLRSAVLEINTKLPKQLKPEENVEPCKKTGYRPTKGFMRKAISKAVVEGYSMYFDAYKDSLGTMAGAALDIEYDIMLNWAEESNMYRVFEDLRAALSISDTELLKAETDLESVKRKLQLAHASSDSVQAQLHSKSEQLEHQLKKAVDTVDEYRARLATINKHLTAIDEVR